MTHAQLILGCNDERGHFCGRMGSVTVGSMEFMASDCRGPALSLEPRDGREAFGAITVYRQRFAIRDHREWVGNWCCDGVTMDAEMLTRFLNVPKFREDFALECAYSEAWELWHSGQPWSICASRLIIEGEL